MAWPREKFGEHLSCKAEVEWEPNSPDLKPLDFFLREFVKDNIYQGKPCTIAVFKVNITKKI